MIDVIYNHFMGKYKKYKDEKTMREMKKKAKTHMKVTQKMQREKKKKEAKIKGSSMEQIQWDNSEKIHTHKFKGCLTASEEHTCRQKLSFLKFKRFL